ncbi:MAG: hypothetical protein ACYDD4_08065 [Acidimicrobiales bacterium]
MSAARTAVAVLGALVSVIAVADLVKALVVPRPQTRSIVGLIVRSVRSVGHEIAYHLAGAARRDRFLAVFEPSLMLVRLASWLGLGFLGFALLMWGVTTMPWSRAFVDSGSSVFTLGFATPGGTVPTAVVFLGAAYGLVTVALQIAYLPALYDAFNRRETLVTLLEGRAGTPAWGPELLARHSLVGIEDSLPDFYAEWERWAADVAESHTTYPSLMYWRSPHEGNSWIVALVAVLDAAALSLSLSPAHAPVQARLCLRMGFTALRDLARAGRIPYDPDPMPDSPIVLSRDDFEAAARWMADAGVPIDRSIEEAWPHFVGWRVNYEAIAYRVAAMVGAPTALWTGPRHFASEVTELPRRPVDRKPTAKHATAD